MTAGYALTCKFTMSVCIVEETGRPNSLPGTTSSKQACASFGMVSIYCVFLITSCSKIRLITYAEIRHICRSLRLIAGISNLYHDYFAWTKVNHRGAARTGLRSHRAADASCATAMF